MSKADDIAKKITARLAQIRVANGYATDLGANLFRGRRQLNPGHLPAGVVVEGDDLIAKDNGGDRVKLTLPIIIEAHLECDPDNPNDVAHQAIADLKRCVFSGDPRWDGAVLATRYVGRIIRPRDDGEKRVAAQVKIELDYVEDLANP